MGANNKKAGEERAAECVRLLEIVFPNQTNHLGTMFGGEVVAIADKAAFFAATKFSKRPAVTASMERIDFKHSIKSGDIVEIEAKVVFTGRSSMVVKIAVFAENATIEGKQLCATGYMTMIALDDEGKPTQVPVLKLETQQERDDWEEARKIRKAHTGRE